MLHNAFDHLVQGTLPLVQALDQPGGGAQFFGEIFFFLVGSAFWSVFVGRVEVKRGQTIVIEQDEKFIIQLVDEDIRADIMGFPVPKLAPGMGSSDWMMSRYSLRSSMSRRNLRSSGL